MSTDSTKEKPATGNSSSTKISSAAENRQSNSTEETTARQHADVDIVGLKLGMTQDQVIAVLKKHNKDLQITFGEFKVTPNARKQHAHLPNHVTSINAQIGTGMRPREKIVVFFSSPPADSAVNQIKRSVSFAQNTLVDTVTSALKEKYGAPTTETYWMFWNYSGNGNESKMCHMAHRMGSNERASFYNPSCNGLELIAFVDTRKEVLGGLTTVLVDHNEITRQVSATHGYRAQLKEERHQKEKKNASENSAPIL